MRKNHHQLQMANVKWKSGGQEQRQIKAKNQCSKKKKKSGKKAQKGEQSKQINMKKTKVKVELNLAM